MIEQTTLAGTAATIVDGKALTTRQQAVWDLVRTTPGVTADEAGALVHSLKHGPWAHSPDERCDFCARDGRAALKAQALKPLITGRRDGRFYPRDPKDAVRPSAPEIVVTEADLARDPFYGL